MGIWNREYYGEERVLDKEKTELQPRLNKALISHMEDICRYLAHQEIPHWAQIRETFVPHLNQSLDVS